MQKQKSFFPTIVLVILMMGIALSSKVFTSQGDGVAKIIVMRGQIKAKLPSGDVVDVEKGMWLKEGTVIQSAPKSFCRLLFIDKSTMNLGADSQMVIDQFPESDAGIITLMKGQVRSKVTKDYMDIKDKDKSKLFIKTRSAAMGVRGTDFQVNYNSRNANTSLVTFSGAVAMARIDEMAGSSDLKFDRNRLEQIVSSREAVIVRKGELSAVTKNSSRATTPQKMSRTQLEGLKKSSPDQSNNQVQKKPQKNYRNPLPPGVDSKKFANDSKKSVQESLGDQIKNSAKRSPASVVSESSNRVPAEGFRDPATGEYAPPAGSVLDLKTVNIIEPPKGSVFDPNTGTYIIPPELGSVDPQSGEYLPPKGMVLTDNGRLIEDSETSRSPASVDSTTATSKNTTRVNSIPEEESNESDDSIDSEVVNDNEDYERLTEETLTESEDQIEDDIEQELIENTRSKASFDFSRAD